MIRPAPRLRRLPVNALIPNLLTVLALCAGLTAIRFGLQERWDAAVAAILVAAVFDALDGRVARLLKGTSKFGAELDSLSDFACFGVVPAILLYRWTLTDLGNFGWIAVLGYATCAALRLARFNSALADPNQPAWTAHFFTGVPAPAGAALVILPLVAAQALGDTVFRNAALNFVWVLAIGVLMISRLPTFSFKKVKVKRQHALPLLLGVVLVVALFLSDPWYTLVGLAIVYLATFPFSLRAHARFRKADAAASDALAELVANPLIDTGHDTLGDEEGDEPPPPPPTGTPLH
jgi:CDP-diacylglycerol--serine O-phosphatidyltransferase